jgi:hypothetical protein
MMKWLTAALNFLLTESYFSHEITLKKETLAIIDHYKDCKIRANIWKSTLLIAGETK